jgi:hypothetical protein
MKNARSFTFFVASAVIVVLTFIFSLLWESLGYGNNVTSLFISIALAIGLSITGVITGIAELRRDGLRNVWFGIIGNALVILSLASIVLYGLDKMI